MPGHKGVIAIDFDGTIAHTEYPTIIKLKDNADIVISALHKEGWFIIINTCRSGVYQQQAVDFLNEMDIPFDLINENHNGLVNYFEADCRKISADIYIDDKSLSYLLSGINWLNIWIEITKYKAQGFKSSLDAFSQLEPCKNETKENYKASDYRYWPGFEFSPSY